MQWIWIVRPVHHYGNKIVKIYYNIEQTMNQTCLIAIPAIAEIAVCRKTAKIMLKNFPVYNSV